MSGLSTSDIQSLVASTAAQLGVDPSLALAVAAAESNFNPNAINRTSGAIGVMQLMPSTASGLGVNPYDVAQNIQGGITYLAQQLAAFGDVAAALAAYNWGPGKVQGAVAAYGAGRLTHAPAETQDYVQRIAGGILDQSPAADTGQGTPAAQPGYDGTTPSDSSSLLLPVLAIAGVGAALLLAD